MNLPSTLNTSKAIVAELKKLDFLRELGVAEWDLSTINHVLDPNVSDEELRQAIYRHAPADQLLAAVEECDQLVRPLDDSYFDFLARRYSHIREFAPASGRQGRGPVTLLSSRPRFPRAMQGDVFPRDAIGLTTPAPMKNDRKCPDLLIWFVV